MAGHYFENENHQSVIPGTISRGLRYLYGEEGVLNSCALPKEPGKVFKLFAGSNQTDRSEAFTPRASESEKSLRERTLQ